MSSHNYGQDNSTAIPSSTVDINRPLSDRLVEYQDQYRSSPTANRAYQMFLARGAEHGHDLDDWLASEREIEAERRRR